MPTYDYECVKCSYKAEMVLKISERELPTTTPCPNCQSNNSVILVVGAPLIGDAVRLGVRKPDPRVTERIEHIKRANSSKL